jgi:perosamine synthetase
MNIPLSGPDIGPTEITLVNQVLSSSSLSMGPMIERFEEALAGYLGVAHAAGVSSGTSGLHLSMIAAGIGSGDEVITSPFSFVASANSILYQRGRPVFVDIDPETMNLDPARIEAAITRKTRAILPVHVFGQPCDMDAIMDIANRHGLTVIEDACEAIGAEFRHKKAGTFGHCAVFAFYPNKQMTTGEGGVIVTNDENWDRLFRSLRNQGRDENGTWLQHVQLGYNYRLDELSAALGVAQMKRLNELLDKRERVALMYTERLADLTRADVPYVAPDTTRMSWFVYVIRLAPDLDREAIMARLAESGVPTRPYFSPIHLQPFYRLKFGYVPGDFPVTEEIARSTLALPFHSNLSEAEIEYVCSSLKKAIQRSPGSVWKVPNADFQLRSTA